MCKEILCVFYLKLIFYRHYEGVTISATKNVIRLILPSSWAHKAKSQQRQEVMFKGLTKGFALDQEGKRVNNSHNLYEKNNHSLKKFQSFRHHSRSFLKIKTFSASSSHSNASQPQGTTTQHEDICQSKVVYEPNQQISMKFITIVK